MTFRGSSKFGLGAAGNIILGQQEMTSRLGNRAVSMQRSCNFGGATNSISTPTRPIPTQEQMPFVEDGRDQVRGMV